MTWDHSSIQLIFHLKHLFIKAHDSMSPTLETE